MNSIQIVNGKDPPDNSSTPPIPVSGCGTPPTSLNIATDADSCGVNPVNHTDLLSSVVPVLPATGRPTWEARAAVPPVVVTCLLYTSRCV